VPLSYISDDVVACQYGVVFDGSGLVSDAQWRRPVCEQLFASWIAANDIPADNTVTVFATDVLFGFDSYALGQEGREALDRFVAEIDDRCCDLSVKVDGHADRIGSENYNYMLSLKRAQSVRDYLENYSRLNARYEVEGFGETMPVVECTGSAATNAELIQCLQPNRRVEVTVQSN